MPPKILVVEDQVDHRTLLVLMLSRLKCEVIEAADGQEGIEKALAELPDLIIMDLMLPGIDGIQATVRLKQDPRTARIPVVAHTIWKEPEYKERALQAGVSEYLVKPTPPQVFHEIVQRFLPAKTQD